MKTLLLILIAFVSNAQISIDSVTPTRICPGDSITYYYQCSSPGTYQFNLDGQNHDYIWHVQVNQGSGYKRFKVPFWWNDGVALASSDWAHTFTVTFCEQVGIEEYKMDIKAAYKQVYGNIYLNTVTGKKFIVVE